jgi:hypothetical protein
MSNVIIGIIGVILFIGLALAGASSFGPRVSQSNAQAQAILVLEKLVSVSNAVKVRDSEREMSTRGGFDVGFLVPDYLGEPPLNPTGGPGPMLLDSAGGTTGIAAWSAIKVGGSRASIICNEISRHGGGPGVAQLRMNANPALPVGCFRIDRDISAEIRKDDYIAYAVI